MPCCIQLLYKLRIFFCYPAQRKKGGFGVSLCEQLYHFVKSFFNSALIRMPLGNRNFNSLVPVFKINCKAICLRHICGVKVENRKQCSILWKRHHDLLSCGLKFLLLLPLIGNNFMPRIVRIINRLNLGGPTYNTVYLTKYLAPEFETILVAGVKQASEESSEFILKSLGVEPVIIPEMSRDISPLKDITAYHKINAIIKKYQPDIVHTHAAKAGALGRVSAIRNKVPVIVHTFHGHFFHSY